MGRVISMKPSDQVTVSMRVFQKARSPQVCYVYKVNIKVINDET